jgi:2-aminoadipate transaminase
MIQNISSKIKDLALSPLQQALALSHKPNIIPFSLGMPDENTFLIYENVELFNATLKTKNLQYAQPAESLKEQIVMLMGNKGVKCDASDIFLTTGAQQALYILIKLFCRAGDSVIVDRFTYPGFVQAATLQQIKLEPVIVDPENGINIDSLEELCNKKPKPKFIYTMSSGHNPLSFSMPYERRKQLAAFAEANNIPIVEDDAYGFLNYDQPLPPIKAFSLDNVVYVGTFSKIVGPSLRVGWMVIPSELMSKLSIIKESLDLNTTSFSQRLITSFLEHTSIETYCNDLSSIYKRRRDTMINALGKHLPELKFQIPQSGFFIWGSFPPSIDTQRLFLLALEQYDVAFIPSVSFDNSSNKKVNNALRLSFSYCPQNLISLGVEKIKKALTVLQT